MKEAISRKTRQLLTKVATRRADHLTSWNPDMFNFAWEQAQDCIAEMLKAQDEGEAAAFYRSYRNRTPLALYVLATKRYGGMPFVTGLAATFFAFADWDAIAKNIFKSAVGYTFSND